MYNYTKMKRKGFVLTTEFWIHTRLSSSPKVKASCPVVTPIFTEYLSNWPDISFSIPDLKYGKKKGSRVITKQHPHGKQ
jgi:hypothetical protein